MLEKKKHFRAFLGMSQSNVFLGEISFSCLRGGLVYYPLNIAVLYSQNTLDYWVSERFNYVNTQTPQHSTAISAQLSGVGEQWNRLEAVYGGWIITFQCWAEEITAFSA